MIDLDIFIFSFNRGKFLLNCVQSAKKHFPSSQITVIDDDSYDSETIKVLGALPPEIKVIRRIIDKNNSPFGGFLKNVQYALDEVAEHDYAIHITDDMQFVRGFTDKDYKIINRYFKLYPKSPLLIMEFHKAEFMKEDKQNIEIDNRVPVYFRNDDALKYSQWGVHISTVGLFNVKLIREARYHFGNSFKEMKQNAQNKFSKMGFYPFPILMFLPFAPTTKHRKKGCVYHLLDYWYKSGFYPYRDMTKEEISEFLERDISILPVADNFLQANKPTPKAPYYIFMDPIKRAPKWVSMAYSIERKIRRF